MAERLLASLDQLHAALLNDLDIRVTDKEKALKNVSGFHQVMVTSDDNHTLMIQINIREFTSTTCGIWIHITLLADKVTDIGGDNVACLCWLIKHKATNFMADRLLNKDHESIMLSLPRPNYRPQPMRPWKFIERLLTHAQ